MLKQRSESTIIEDLGLSFVEDVGRYVVPIFSDYRRRPSSTGTGFLLNTGFGHALVTAAHVLDGLRNDQHYYFYATPGTKRAIQGVPLLSKIPASGKRDDDSVDVAIVLLEGAEGELPPFQTIGRESMPLDLLEVQGAPRSQSRYAFLGFPGSKGKVNPIARNVTSASYAYASSSSPPAVYSKLGLDESSHIVLPFNERHIVTLSGQRLNFPSPKGMSGSPLWSIRPDNAGGRRVVGVMIEHCKRENVVIAASIWFVLRMITDYYQSVGLIVQG